jgi:hypothetical protein
MMVRKRFAGGILLTGAATVLMIAVNVGAANAGDGTYTITPGGDVTLKAGLMTLTDANTGTTLSCRVSSPARLKSGSGAPGNDLGNTTNLPSFTNCTGPQGQSFSIDMYARWHWSAKFYNAATSVTGGFLNGVEGGLFGPDCSAGLNTNFTSHQGRMKVRYTNSTGRLQVLSDIGSVLIGSVDGCTGLFNSGSTPDSASFSGIITVSPRQTITSP